MRAAGAPCALLLLVATLALAQPQIDSVSALPWFCEGGQAFTLGVSCRDAQAMAGHNACAARARSPVPRAELNERAARTCRGVASRSSLL
jgi:hypothetical protein